MKQVGNMGWNNSWNNNLKIKINISLEKLLFALT